MQPSSLTLYRGLTFLGYFGLMIGIYVWHFVINQTESHLISVVLLLQLGPLMLPLRGLLNGKTYTHAWSIYLAIFYFIMSIWYCGAEETLYFGLYLTACSLLFLAGTMLFTRFNARLEKEEAADSGSKTD